MPVSTHPVMMTDAKIAERIKDLLKKVGVDPKKFEETIAFSSQWIRQMEGTILESRYRYAVTTDPMLQPGYTGFGLPTFGLLAKATLEHVGLRVGQPVIPVNTHFNSGEIAEVPVTITNTCHLPLRDIVVELTAIGPVTVLSHMPPPMNTILNPQHLTLLQPGHDIVMHFFVSATSVNNITPAALRANLSAEVVPHVNRTPAECGFEVWPND
ncbi:MAG: hypothetical protein ACHQ52_14130 [Candidatus Eisenbacteria bacterium]